MTKRVAFTFDEKSYHTLYEMAERGSYRSMAEVIRESLQVMQALRQQAEQGFTEIILRNPKTDKERVVVIPSLERGR
jgi:Arc/MetJ-type ribon-helix-helix transcriptional regulator